MEITINMLKRILPILLVSAVLLTACGSTPTPPPVNPADIQNTAVAAAQTIVALTSAAMPTATPIPPTDVPSPTPLPTFTPEIALLPPTAAPVELPTLMPTLTGPTQSPTDCYSHPINFGEAGPTKNVRIENTLKYTVTISFNMGVPNLFGQCGVYAVRALKGQWVVVHIPSGSYYIGAYSEKPPQPNGVSVFLGPSNTKDILRVVVKTDKLIWVGP